MPNWKKVIISGSDASLNSLNATTSLTASGLIYPDTDGDNGDFLSTDGQGNLSFGRSTVYANVKNISGGTLQKGTPVHANGTAGNASEVIAASASVASTMPATYVLNETLADDAEGLAIITGYINGVNTSLFGEGDVIYVGESGGFTNVKPQGSDNLIQNLGVVSKVDATNGSGYVYGSGRSNDIPNLPEGKVWVGSSTYSVTSSILTLDEPSSEAQITGSLIVNGSGSTVLDVIGSVGTLFSVDDDLSGTLFSANDVSGFPVLQASASGDVFIGKTPQSLYTTAVISSTIGSTTTESICSLSTSSYDGAFFEYTAREVGNTNSRAGSIMAVWNGGNISFTDTSTRDIGNTSLLIIKPIISGSTARLVVYGDSGFKVKTIIKAI